LLSLEDAIALAVGGERNLARLSVHCIKNKQMKRAMSVDAIAPFHPQKYTKTVRFVVVGESLSRREVSRKTPAY
jgi:hypothetical protein